MQLDQLCSLLLHTQLFQGISLHDARALCRDLSITTKSYQCGEYIHAAGDVYHTMGIILEGKASMISIDLWGNQNLIREFHAFDHYGDAHSMTKTPMFFDIVARESCTVAFLNTDLLLEHQQHPSPPHQQLQINLTRIIAQRKIDYMRMSDVLGKRSTREKVMAYLSNQAQMHSSTSFCIPLNRQHLADYLAVDRSSLSRELSKMQREGIISFKGSCFVLHNTQTLSDPPVITHT